MFGLKRATLEARMAKLGIRRLCAALTAVTGCKKEEPTPGSEAAKPDEGVAAKVAKVVDAAKTAVKETADQAAAQVKAAQDQAQGLIDRAKGLVNDKKYQEALSSLGQLANLKLTPEQQKLVDDLKAQVQTALSKAAGSDAASALGGALGGKK
jgi:hypothetical protein